MVCPPRGAGPPQPPTHRVSLACGRPDLPARSPTYGWAPAADGGAGTLSLSLGRGHRLWASSLHPARWKVWVFVSLTYWAECLLEPMGSGIRGSLLPQPPGKVRGVRVSCSLVRFS